MSTFQGKMEELDYISIDKFDDKNLSSDAFFLSHCHTDHMRGLRSREFEVRLFSDNIFLYMSHVSKTIIENISPYLCPKIKVLDINNKNYIDIPNVNKTIAVTVIPAGHCPGSVMFLFEEEKTVLYTGDIRIRVNELQKYKQLRDSTGNLKRIDNIYLDTTFFSKSYKHFPSREEGISEFCKQVNDWLEKDEKNVVFINVPYHYGLEHLYIEIYKRCRQKIHVEYNRYEVYSRIPELDDAVVQSGKNARIHSQCMGTYLSICIDVNYINLLKIKPCALSWNDYDFTKGIVKEENGLTKICYSSHSSYNEIIDILKFLKPLKITPNVVPKDEEKQINLENLIEEILKEIHETECDKTIYKESQSNFSWTKSEDKKENEEEFLELFKMLDSPEAKRQKCD